MTYDANFVPLNCVAGSVPAVILGSGVSAADVYKFTKDHGHSITLGACPSVGVAGGFSMGGGHGP